jgi:hypothetical protein
LITNVYASESNIQILEQFDNLRVVVFIEKEDISNSPEWNPNFDAPPLTIFEAIQAIKDFNKTSDIVGPIKEIEIRPVPKYEKHWHYLIKIADDSMRTKYSIYVVLMNGEVIPAIIEPQSYK